MSINKNSSVNHRTSGARGRILAGIAVAAGTIASATSAAAAEPLDSPDSFTERLVHRYLQVAIAPNGAYVASVEGDSPRGGYHPEVRDLVIRRVADGTETRVTLPCGRVPQCWPASPAWSPDGKHLSFALRAPHSHAYAVYDVAPNGTGLTQLLAFSGTLTDLKYGSDGTLAMLAIENARKEVGATEAGAAIAGDLDTAPTEQRIAELTDGSLRWASPADLFVYEYDWRPAGAGFVGTAAPGDGDNNWWTAKLYAFAPNGQARMLYTPAGIRQQLADPKVSHDGKTVAFIAGIMSDFGSTGGDVYTMALDGGAALNVTPGVQASATSLAWSCHGNLRAALLAGDQDQIVEFGAGRLAAPPRVLWSGTESLNGEEAGASWSCPSETLAAAYETFTTAPEIRVGRIGHWRDLTHVNAGLTAPFEVRSLSWRNEALDVQGWLLMPLHTSGKIPMVTVVHGGPAAASRPGFAGPGLRAALIQRGWAVFYPNPRGSFGQGERFAAANIRDFGYGDLRDVLTGIDAAVHAAPIDEARLGLTGGSYGGFMTMWAVTQTNRFKAAVAAAGLSNWQSYYGENGIDEWMLPYFGSSVYDDPAVYARSSAINYIKNVHTPTFVYVGERDIECPAPQTQEFWHALKAEGVPTAVMIYAGEGHGLRDPKNSQDALERTVAWFDKYLNY
jgi:dipeptidyl aminopeptidase/acylaminoacyl peptidase